MAKEGSNFQTYTDDFHEYTRITVDPEQQALRIDKFLMDRLKKVTRNRLQNAIRAGAVQVDQQEVKPNFKVKPGQVIDIVVPRPPGAGEGLKPQDIPLDVVYEDDNVLVINKKPGMVVHPGVGNYDGTLVNALAFYLKEDDLPVMEGNDRSRIGLVHRIDKDTSGLMVIAKDEYSMSYLAKQFFHHTIERKYVALVWGQPEAEEGSIDCHIGRHPKNRLVRTCFPDGSEGKEAITHYKVLEGMYYVSLVQCQLETGRTHQIRVHMQHLGHPLFNDERYGGSRIMKGTVFTKYRQFVENCFQLLPRQALHAKSLGFEHPLTKQWMHFESDLPEDMTACLERWRTYVHAKRNQLHLENPED